MNIAILCAGLLGILLFSLSAAVSLMRRARGKGFGMDPDPTSTLSKAIRAQGNAAEYTPALMLLFIFLGTGDPPATWVYWTIILLTAGRFMHAAGMYLSPNLNAPQILRVVGTSITYAGGTALSIEMIRTAL